MFKARLTRTQTSSVEISVDANSKDQAIELIKAACICLQNGMIVEIDGPLEWKPTGWHHDYQILPRL